MRKDSGTVSGEDSVQWLQGRRYPNDQVTVPHVKSWHPSRMKTGLRNRPVGRKVPVVALRA
jgi:hypothetical protein